MKIVHLANYILPGLGYQENFLSGYLKRAGAEAKLVVSNLVAKKYEALFPNKTPGTFSYNGDFDYIKLPCRRFHFETMVWLKGLKATLKLEKPDVVYCNTLWSLNTFRACWYKKSLGYFLVVDDHMDNGNFRLNSTFRVILFSLYRFYFSVYLKNKVDLFVSVNYESQKALKEVFKVDSILVPLGINTRIFYPSPGEGEEMRKKYQIKPGEKILVFTGNIEGTKGLDLALAALRDLPPQIQWHFFLIGKVLPVYEETFKRLIQNDTRVHLIKWVEQSELRAFYNMADLAILPGKLGGMREAMGCGTPLMISSELGVKFLHTSDVLTFNSRDANDLNKKLKLILSDDKLIQELKYLTLKLVEDQLSWGAVTKNFYAQLLSLTKTRKKS